MVIVKLHLSPTHKRDSRHEIGYYRPMNNTSPISKLFETSTRDVIKTAIVAK